MYFYIFLTGTKVSEISPSVFVSLEDESAEKVSGKRKKLRLK